MSDQNQTPDPAHQLTKEQGATIARGLYQPTVRRMNVLCSSLISTTQNGDFALWAPMTVMQQQLLDLRWTDAPGAARFLSLIVLTLRRYAEKCEVYKLAYLASAEAGAPPPTFPAWEDDDTRAVYDEIDALFPLPPAVDDPADAGEGGA